MARPRSPSIPAGTMIGGKYLVGAKLGVGGMGAVFEATDASGQKVALKTLLVGPGAPAAASETRKRFDREVAACTRIVHPNVTPLLDHGVDEATGAPYLVMAKMHGEDLAGLLARVKLLEPAVAVPLVLQACRGVAAGHAAGIVHRDIKPSNLFLEEEGGRIVVKVSDFGLAKVQSAGIDSLTKSGAILGTPHYMAPEQAQDAKRVDARADVYSLGMVLIHCLTGAPAFKSPGAFMSFLVGQTAIPPLQESAPWVAPELARAVHASVLRSPDARWPDLSELELGLTMAAGYTFANATIIPTQLAAISEATRSSITTKAELPTSWEELLRH